jgi:hypothetical protein
LLSLTWKIKLPVPKVLATGVIVYVTVPVVPGVRGDENVELVTIPLLATRDRVPDVRLTFVEARYESTSELVNVIVPEVGPEPPGTVLFSTIVRPAAPTELVTTGGWLLYATTTIKGVEAELTPSDTVTKRELVEFVGASPPRVSPADGKLSSGVISRLVTPEDALLVWFTTARGVVVEVRVVAPLVTVTVRFVNGVVESVIPMGTVSGVAGSVSRTV